MAEEREYLLGTDREELDRLALQHRLWSSTAHDLWRRAAVRPGMRVLDVGCGPGFASMDLATLVGPSGAVVGLDESKRYIEHLTREAAARGFGQVRAINGDVHEVADAVRSGGPFDAAYIRWVLCFVRDAGQVIRGIASVLKPGGKLMVQDYFNYHGCVALAPRRASFTRAIEAVAKSWRASGGDLDVMGHVPRLFREAGLNTTHLDSVHRTARSTDQMWTWPTIFWRSFLPRLVSMGFLTEDERIAFDADWAQASADPDSWICLPPIFEAIGVKS